MKGFRVQGSGFKWFKVQRVQRVRRILDDGIPVSSAFPSRGRRPEGADRALAAGKTDEKTEKCAAPERKRESLTANDKDFSLRLK